MIANENRGQPHPELEIIYGAERIADVLGVSRRQVYHACDRHGLPHFRIGAVICARPAALGRWLESREEAGVAESAADQSTARSEVL